MANSIFVPIFVESRYKLDRKRIKETVENLLREKAISGPVEVSIAIVGDRKMHALNKKYRNLDKTTNVLSFSQTEGENSATPTDMLLLGDVVISYPQVIREAAEEEVMVDHKICELVEHGLRHLLGEHHE